MPVRPASVWTRTMVASNELRGRDDQLGRNGAVKRTWTARAASDLRRAEMLAGSKRQSALTTLADRLDHDADGSGDAARVRALAAVVRDLANTPR